LACWFKVGKVTKMVSQKKDVSTVALPGLSGGWGRYKLVSALQIAKQGFNNEPGWAMLVVNETNISE
jgi:hypothetical protein